MSFLPEGYQEPVESNYMSFEEGENTFRVLGKATVGWEYWKEVEIEGKTVNRPVRVKEHENIPLADVVTNKFGNLNLSYFWAFPVYNFDALKIQILTIKQKTVRRPMNKTINNPKWGDPKDYNFVVSRDKDESGKTNYTVGVEPKEKLDESIIEKFNGMKIDMKIWMDCGDPFTQEAKDELPREVQDDVDSSEVADSIPF